MYQDCLKSFFVSLLHVQSPHKSSAQGSVRNSITSLHLSRRTTCSTLSLSQQLLFPWEEVTRTSGKEGRWENQSQKPGTQPPIQYFYYSAPH